MNPGSGGNRDVVELWGRQFNIVKNGLSETQVVSFVNDLAKQHDMLLQRHEHLSALSKLAERTVAEADRLAGEMKEEAKKAAEGEAAKIIIETQTSAKAEAERVISEAQTRADALIKEKIAEAMAAAESEAASLKSEAELIADQMKTDATTKANHIVGDAEARGRHIVEQREAEAIDAADKKAADILATAEQEAATILEREKTRIQPVLAQLVQGIRQQLLFQLENLQQQVKGFESPFQLYPGDTAESVATARSTRGNEPDALMELVANSNQQENGDPEWEVEIVPPIDIMKIMNVVGYLDSLPEVVRTEIIPRNECTSVIVYTGRPVPLIDFIKDLPEVGHAEEIVPEGDSKTKRISLALSNGTVVSPTEEAETHPAVGE